MWNSAKKEYFEIQKKKDALSLYKNKKVFNLILDFIALITITHDNNNLS